MVFVLSKSEKPKKLQKPKIKRADLQQTRKTPKKGLLKTGISIVQIRWRYPVLYRVSSESRAGEWEL